jgi:hypothetical protein
MVRHLKSWGGCCHLSSHHIILDSLALHYKKLRKEKEKVLVYKKKMAFSKDKWENSYFHKNIY